MTTAEFLEQLEQAILDARPKRAYLAGAAIRIHLLNTGAVCCPTTIVEGHQPPWRFLYAAKSLELPFDTALALAQAADKGPSHDPQLRQALLETCGLAGNE